MFESFFRGDYMPHGHCYLWQPHILYTHVISDILIALAYFSIPVGIMVFVRGRKDIKDHSVFILFSLFIVFCGFTHLLGIWTIWQGVYGIHGVSKAMTALVSVATSIYIFRALPEALAIPSVEQFQGVVQELSDQSDQNEKLLFELETHKLARIMLDSLPISALLLDQSGVIKLSNKSTETEFSLERNNLINASIQDIFTPIDDNFETKFEQFIAANIEDKDVSFLGDIRPAHKGLIPVELIVTCINYTGTRFLLVTLKNLSEVTEIKQELLESHLQLERATKATQDGIFEFDMASNTASWSEQMFSLIGVSPNETPSLELFMQHVHQEHADRLTIALNQHFESREQFNFEYLGLNPKGEYGWFHIRANSSFSNDGKPLILAGSLRYIQNQKETEDSERQKANFLTAIYDGSNQGIWATECLPDNEFKFVEYNDTALERSGPNVSKDMVINKTLSELSDTLFPASLVERLRKNYAACASSGRTLQYTEQFEVGNTQWYQTSLYPVFDENRFVTHVIGSAIDITEQKNAENALDEQKTFLEGILNNSVCGLYIYDLTKQTNIQINDRYTDILGYTLDDITQIDDFGQLFHPDDQDKVLEHISEVISSDTSTLVSLEYRIKHKNGNWVWCYSYDSILKRDKHGAPLLMLGTFIDVTEKNDLLTQLSESNEYLERFAFIASHDLQEPLRKINSFSESLIESLEGKLETETERYELSRINDAASRMRMMIRDLLSLSRITTRELNLRRCNINTVIERALSDLSLLIDEKQAIIETQVSTEYFYIDSSLFKQVVQNLIQNALKFVPESVKPHIVISTTSDSVNDIIEVKDNGIGMDMAHVQTIFDPFKRLHRRDEYSGSGIGLAIVKQIMKVHGGTVSCESKLGVGSVFTLKLPRFSNV